MRENFYLLDYLKQNKAYSEEILDIFKNKFDEKVYSYGAQFKFPYETRKTKKRPLGFYARLLKIFITKHTVNNLDGKRIVSNAYFSMNDELRKMGYSVMTPPWGFSRDSFTIPCRKLLKEYYKFSYLVENANYSEMLTKDFYNEYIRFKKIYKDSILSQKISAICVPSDMNVWDRISIKVAKEIGIPSFLFSHGLPGRYNSIDETRIDYLIVWGEKIKQNYINYKHNEKSIYVSGHPLYKQLKNSIEKNSFDNILVLTHSMGQAQTAADVILSDRGNCALYLYMVENVLQKFGVKKACYRPHPSENGLWYTKFIDNDFYSLDTVSLSESLSKRTLIIGPTSTVFLESFFYGVNYIIFEPSINNIDVMNYPLIPPFDGSEKDVIVAKNEEELYQVLNDKCIQSKDFINRYVSDTFSLDFIRELI